MLGITDLMHAQRFGVHFTVGGSFLMAFGAFDLFTLWFKPRVQPYPWWLLHVAKFFYLWMGLAGAFYLRVAPGAVDRVRDDNLTMPLIWLLLCGFLYWLYRPAMKDLLSRCAQEREVQPQGK